MIPLCCTRAVEDGGFQPIHLPAWFPFQGPPVHCSHDLRYPFILDDTTKVSPDHFTRCRSSFSLRSTWLRCIRSTSLCFPIRLHLYYIHSTAIDKCYYIKISEILTGYCVSVQTRISIYAHLLARESLDFYVGSSKINCSVCRQNVCYTDYAVNNRIRVVYWPSTLLWGDGHFYFRPYRRKQCLKWKSSYM